MNMMYDPHCFEPDCHIKYPGVRMCGLCDGWYCSAHSKHHPTLRCKTCDWSGLSENHHMHTKTQCPEELVAGPLI